MKRCIAVLATIVLLAAAGISWRAKAETDGSAKLRALEAEFVKATAEHGLDGFMSYFAEDASELPNGSAVVTGKENIRHSLEPWGPDLSLTWTPVEAEMAASGDLGYTFGHYVLKTRDKDGKAVVEYGKYATVWKKQKDGGWKVVMDMGNSGPSADAKP
jgi:ketosteroid isomerase-like protein